jgi:hypothetical protein
MPPKPKPKHLRKCAQLDICPDRLMNSGEDDEEQCDTLLVTRSALGDGEAMKVSARAALEQSLAEDELYIEDVRGDL